MFDFRKLLRPFAHTRVLSSSPNDLIVPEVSMSEARMNAALNENQRVWSHENETLDVRASEEGGRWLGCPGYWRQAEDFELAEVPSCEIPIFLASG